MADSQEFVPHLQKYSITYIGFNFIFLEKGEMFHSKLDKECYFILLYVGSGRMVGILPYLWLVLVAGVEIQIYLIFLFLIKILFEEGWWVCCSNFGWQ
jgi:hypothetical protein